MTFRSVEAVVPIEPGSRVYIGNDVPLASRKFSMELNLQSWSSRSFLRVQQCRFGAGLPELSDSSKSQGMALPDAEEEDISPDTFHSSERD